VWRADRAPRQLQPHAERIERGRIALGVGSQNRHALRARDGVSVEQALRGAREHHAGQVVAAEDGGLLVSALGDDDAARANLDQVLGRHQRHPVIGVIAGRVGARQQPYPESARTAASSAAVFSSVAVAPPRA